jgi:two-component system, NtrC family, sensor kinase
MTASQDATIAELQRANAELRREREAGLAREATLAEELAARDAVLAQRNTQYSERIEHQAATVDVLKVMSASPGEAQPVFDLIVRQAKELCNCMGGALYEYDGELVHLRAKYGGDTDAATVAKYTAMFPMAPTRASFTCRAIINREVVHIRDTDAEPEQFAVIRDLERKAQISVPLLRDGIAIGAIALGAEQAGGFSDSQVALLQTFAEQAVIAITSAETYRALQTRTAALAQRNSEYGEQIEQQSATIDVLKVMSSTPDDTQPVFDQIVRRATELCNGEAAALYEFDGELVRLPSTFWKVPDESALTAYAKLFPRPPSHDSFVCRAILERQIVHIRDFDQENYAIPEARDLGSRSRLMLPLMRDGRAIGAIALNAKEPGGFSDSQVALLQTFAEQAVIAITSVANFRALRERTAELTRSVAELQALEEVLRAVNSSLDLGTVLSTIISRAVQLSEADEGTIYEFDEAEDVFVPKSAHGMAAARVEALRERRIRIGETPLGNSAAMRAPLHIPDLTQTLDIDGSRELVEDGIHALLAVPLLREGKVLGGLVIRRRAVGGFASTVPTLLQTFAGQCVLAIENARLFQEARQARVEAEATLGDLRRAQDRLVQSEKMASLGQLTAGIAHEIKNPLNFVNNFAALSVDLLSELNETVSPGFAALTDDQRAEIEDVSAMLTSNLEKIIEHGKRADGIVKAMLEHSRGSSGERRMVDLNALIDEALNLAYHGARAQDQSFNITLERDSGEAIAQIEVNPQDMTRVFLNLFSNGFYAATKRARNGEDARFEPTLKVTSRNIGDAVEIRVRDNGAGIQADIRDKLFQPFFTTKPTGEGTGLGLSITYDIVTKAHGGSIAVDSKVGDYTEFTIRLPRNL